MDFGDWGRFRDLGDFFRAMHGLLQKDGKVVAEPYWSNDGVGSRSCSKEVPWAPPKYSTSGCSPLY